LDLVDRSAARLHPTNTGPLPFILPYPRLFLTPTGERQQRFFRNWLLLREPWLVMVEQDAPSVRQVRNQMWRDCLSTDINSDSARTGTKAADRRKYICELLAPCYKDEDIRSGSPPLPSWFGRTLDVVAQRDMREVIWELYELSFRFEILMLDRLLLPRNKETTERVILRDNLIRRCFSETNDSFRVLEIPTDNVALASTRVKGRGKLLEQLRRVMVDWPNRPGALKVPFDPKRSDEDNMVQEEAMYAFYCQTFYNYFGRAPVLPRRVC
ncbi:hypothetical protein B0H21DRAFT_704548, partial [Amylocystis lapponica]